MATPTNPNAFLYKKPNKPLVDPEAKKIFDARFANQDKNSQSWNGVYTSFDNNNWKTTVTKWVALDEWIQAKTALDSAVNVAETQTTAPEVQTTTPVETTAPTTTIEKVTPVTASIPTPSNVSVDFLTSQSSWDIAQLVVDNKIKYTDLQQLNKSDPLKYQEVTANIQKKQAEAQYNMTSEQYKKSMDTYLSDINSIKTPSADERVAKYQEFLNTPQFNSLTNNLTGIVWKVNELNDQLEYLVDDIIEQNQWSSGLLISALTNKSRKELVRERNWLIAEATLLQSQIEQVQAQAQQKYQMYEQSVAEEKAMKLEYIAQKYNIDTQKVQMDFQVLEKRIQEADMVLSWVSAVRAKEADYAREMAKEDLKFEREMAKEDIKFERDMYKSQVEADRNFSYDKVLKSMDIESQFAIKDFDIQSQFAMLRLKHELDQSWVEYDFQKMDDWTIMAINKKNPSDSRVLWSNWKLWGDYLTTIWTGKITSYWWAHDNYQWIDIDGKIGDPIPSIWGRVVKVVSWQWKSSKPSYWNYVDVQDANGNIHRYAHLNSVNVNVWDEIPYGTSIWQMGNSWYTIAWPNGDWSHLDYSVKKADWTWFNAKEIPWYLATVQPKDKLTPEQLTLFSSLQSIQTDIKNDTQWFNRAVGTRWFIETVRAKVRWTWELWFSVWSQAGAFASKVEQFRNLLTLPALQYLKWPTSDKDIQFIRSAQSTLSTDLPETEFIKIVDEIEQIMIRNYWTDVDLSEFWFGNSTPASSYLPK